MALAGPRQQVLLAFLLLNANRAVSADALIDAVWGAERAGAMKRLQMAISRLRRALEPLELNDGPRLRTISGGYLLVVQPGELDADVFAERVREGRRVLEEGDPVRAGEVLADALGLWRGPPLAEVAFEDFAQPDIRRLVELRLSALEARIEADLEMGRHRQLIPELEALLAEHATRDGFAAQLMTALYRCGRQTEALQVFDEVRRRMVSDLGLEPGPALVSLQTKILHHDPELQARHTSADTNSFPNWASEIVDSPSPAPAQPPLPATPMIGRQTELEIVHRLFAEDSARIVSLTGPGGVGKTRLAAEAARDLATQFRDGLAWVELASISETAAMPSAIARAMRITPLQSEQPMDALVRWLATKRLLLALDNLEHLVGAAEALASLLQRCAGLRMLVTSREALELAGEHRVAVMPLGVPPPPERASAADVTTSDAGALFIAAARRRVRDLTIDPATAAATAEVCRRLDGLPLALELAAARLGFVSIAELADDLGDSFLAWNLSTADAPDRHRTLRATIDWSVRRLSDAEQNAFTRFAVFAGGATWASAVAVTQSSRSDLEALVAKSLIVRRVQPDGRSRLMMLETIRSYAEDRSYSDRERLAVRQRHLDHYLAVIEDANAELDGHHASDALDAIDQDIDNVRAALQWALSHAPLHALRLAGLLSEYWRLRGEPKALVWLRAALDATGEDAPPRDRARAYLGISSRLSLQADAHAAEEAARSALDFYRSAGDEAGMAQAWLRFAAIHGQTRDRRLARREAQAAVHHAELSGDNGLIGRALSRLAMYAPADEREPILVRAIDLLTAAGADSQLAGLYLNAGFRALCEDQVEPAFDLLRRATSAAGRHPAPTTSMFIAGNLGLANAFSQRPGEARAAFHKQLRLCRQYAIRFGSQEGLAGIAALEARVGRDHCAAQLLGAARALGYPGEADKPIYNRLERDFYAPARCRYGESAWRQAESLGAQLSHDQAIDLALTTAEALPETEAQQFTSATSTSAEYAERSSSSHVRRLSRRCEP